MIEIDLKSENWKNQLLQDLAAFGITPSEEDLEGWEFNYKGRKFSIYHSKIVGRKLEDRFAFNYGTYTIKEFFKNASSNCPKIDVEGLIKKADDLEEKANARKTIKNVLGITGMFVEQELINDLEKIHSSFKLISTENNLEKNRSLTINFSLFDKECYLSFYTTLTYKKFKDADIKTLNWELHDKKTHHQFLRSFPFDEIVRRLSIRALEYDQQLEKIKEKMYEKEELERDLIGENSKLTSLEISVKNQRTVVEDLKKKIKNLKNYKSQVIGNIFGNLHNMNQNTITNKPLTVQENTDDDEDDIEEHERDSQYPF